MYRLSLMYAVGAPWLALVRWCLQLVRSRGFCAVPSAPRRLQMAWYGQVEAVCCCLVTTWQPQLIQARAMYKVADVPDIATFFKY